MKLFLFISVLPASIFFSCSSDKNKDVDNRKITAKTNGRKVSDSLANPVVTYITAANAPKVIKAGKPVIKPLTYPYGIGKPTFTHYSTADGLPNNSVMAAASDQEGNIWFSTYSGISKYNGTGFTNYSSENGLPSDFCRALFIDSRNNIWISTEGLCIFDGKKFTKPVVDSTMPGAGFNASGFFEDKEGAVWFWLNAYSSEKSDLYKYQHGRFTKYASADFRFPADGGMVQDKNGHLMIPSLRRGVTRGETYLFDGRSLKPYTEIPAKGGKSPLILLCDSKGDLWFDDQNGSLEKYDGNKITSYAFKGKPGSLARYFKMLQDSKGNYWIASDAGLLRFDGESFTRYSSKDGIQNSIFWMSTDKSGNIWAVGHGGVTKISYSIISELESPGSAQNPGLIEDTAGNLWTVGIDGLGKIDRDHIAFYKCEPTSLPGFLSNPYLDHSGNIWLSSFHYADRSNPLSTTWSQLIRFDGHAFTFFGKELGLDAGRVDAIMEDDKNILWVVGERGIVKFDGTSFTLYALESKRGGYGITSVMQDQRGNYWFGSPDSGVYKFDGTSFINYSKRHGLPNNFINKITEDASGNIWLATDGGASKFDGTGFTNYRGAEGLSNAVVDIKYDPANEGLWFVSYMGAAFLPKEEIGMGKPVFQHFNAQTGFNLSGGNFQGVMIDKKGVVWINEITKIFRLDYNKVKELDPVAVRIENIRLDNKNVSWEILKNNGKEDSLSRLNEMAIRFGKQLSEEQIEKMKNDFNGVRFDSISAFSLIPSNLVLPHKNNNIVFEFAAVSPSFGRSVRYQYMLEGYDKTWSPISNKTEASFGNMNEGSFIFKVRALNPGGQWSETSYSFRVLPPWYRTWWAYALYALLFITGISLFIRWRTKALQKEKLVLEQKVNTRTAELKESLENLKATQSQLIQSEKMASLGELTAGIAHEIQNPLNFVNNFSEVNTELIDELEQEADKGNMDEVKALAKDIRDNEQKINHHGKRADAIVKGMLQHSRSSSGVKEPTDINALADEYLRLAYHGLRAKDKSFNATMKTDFDPAVGMINIIPQDIGRVILNLITNAFYVVNEKKTLQQAQGDNYEPTVSVSTRKVNGKVEIKVADNGNGIPQKVLDKIFQPFFTTKPTGQGTGLGLSLSYDIVKAHGGEINVNTKEGEGTEFIVQMTIS